jgi:type IV pilus assembly protein PilM
VLFGKSKSLVGLDIGSSSVKLVELKPMTKGEFNWKLVNLGVAQLAPEVIVDGSIMDSTVVVDAIQQLFRENKVKTNDVAIAVSGHSVIIKKITMAYMSEEELAESIRWEAESYIPFDIDDVQMDYQVLDEADRGDGNMDVLLVAAKKEKVSEYVSVVQQSGKNPVVVDVDSFALQNALTSNYELSDLQVTALINIGASVMNINIMQGRNTVFWRDISFGGNVYTDAIQKDLGVDFESAEVLKRGESIDDIDFEQVIPVLQSVTQDLGVEVQKTFDFFKATAGSDKIDRIMLTGGCSKILNLDSFLADRFDAQVEILNPFQNISYNEKQFNSQVIHDLRASAAIAVGLAMRRGGDK